MLFKYQYRKAIKLWNSLTADTHVITLSSKPINELASISNETKKPFFSFISPNSMSVLNITNEEMNKPFHNWIVDCDTVKNATEDILCRGIIVNCKKGYYLKIQQMRLKENLYICKFLKCYQIQEFTSTSCNYFPSLKYEIPYSDNAIYVGADDQIMSISSNTLLQLNIQKNDIINKQISNFVLGDNYKKKFKDTIRSLISSNLKINNVRSYILLSNMSTVKPIRIPYLADIKITDDITSFHLFDLRVIYEMKISDPIVIIDNKDTVLYANQKWSAFKIDKDSLISRTFSSFISTEFRPLYKVEELVGKTGQLIKLSIPQKDGEALICDVSIHASYFGFEQGDEKISVDMKSSSLILLDILPVDTMNTESTFEGTSLMHDVRNKITCFSIDLDDCKQSLNRLEKVIGSQPEINVLYDKFKELYRKNSDLKEDLSHRLETLKSANGSRDATFGSYNFYKDIFVVASQNIETDRRGKSIELVTNCDAILKDSGTYIRCDKNYLKRVFENLLFNAIKFTPIRGTITFSAIVEKQDKKTYTIVIRVKDTGDVPIDKSDYESVFGMFKQTKNKKGGYGVGLALVKLAATRHGGDACIESSTHEGTTFKVTVVLEKSKKPDDILADNRLCKLNALIVDGINIILLDSPTNIMIMKKYLSDINIKSESASSISEAKEKLKKHFDIMIVDKVHNLILL